MKNIISNQAVLWPPQHQKLTCRKKIRRLATLAAPGLAKSRKTKAHGCTLLLRLPNKSAHLLLYTPQNTLCMHYI